MTNISVLGLRVVKETSGRYDVDRKINNSNSATKIFNDVLELNTRTEEIVALMTLDTKCKVTGLFIVSQGSLSSGIVHPREVFKRALMQNAASVIISHNHPSGDPTPSKEDINITKRLKSAGDILGVELLDHIIIADNNMISFKEKGLL